MWASLYTPIGKLKYEKLNYRVTKLSTLLEELLSQDFSGYVEILAPHEHGLIVFCKGIVYSCFYEGTEDLNLSQKEIIEHFLRTETTERETIINVGELEPNIITALSALESRTPAHRELETVFLDMSKLFETFARKNFTGTLRFYRIRNNTRLGNILLRLEKITAEQLRDAIRLQLSGEGALRLGDALVQIGAIDEKGIEEALDRQNVTRKGSDLELALAVFHEGEFLGGYRFTDKILIKDKLEVIKWLAMTEVLMDIIDGGLPEALDVKTILHPENMATLTAQESTAQAGPSAGPGKPPPKPAVNEKAKLKTAGDDRVMRELTHETFMLKADDLILDIHAHPDSSAPEDEEAADKNLSWLDELINKQETETTKEKEVESKPAIPAGLAKAAERIVTTKVEKDIDASEENIEAQLEEIEKPVQPKETVGKPKMNPPEVSRAIERVLEKASAPEKQSAPESAALSVPESLPDSAKPDEREKTETSTESVEPVQASEVISDKEPSSSEEIRPDDKDTVDQGETQPPSSETPVVTPEPKAVKNDDPGLASLQRVVLSHMGFLGQALIDRETKHIEIPQGQTMSLSHLKSLNQRLYHANSLIVGEKNAERIMIEVENELEASQ